MKKMICLLLAGAMLLSGCSVSGSKEEKMEETTSMEQEETMTNAQLLTVDELAEIAGIEKEAYGEDILESFIEYFVITKENVGDMDVLRFLEGYLRIMNKVDVSSILDSDLPERESDFTKDASAAAFFVSWGTSIEAVYYDLENGLRYRGSNMDLFSDLNQVEPEEYTEGENLLTKLEEAGVFTWENVRDTEGIEDYQVMELVVLYSDGTMFKVEAAGILAQLLPESYAEVRALLLE